ncbi:MAG: aminotransferase class I/II-fold pyridoxal phosphate-dependent enzyme [Spirochaetales bacterium]|nr:aminotransferase class I/II-fold pyridoxal phosphate-dependent enzyme [Spirochaetales bacterium]
MADFQSLSHQDKQQLKDSLQKRINEYKAQVLQLDMTRGKPGPEQLDICNDLLTCVDENHFMTGGGVDTRNYGILDGITEAKELFADFMGAAKNEIIVGGNSSLNMMYDIFAQLMTHGSSTDSTPWFSRKKKFICPVPGYDRHFTICQRFGIEMINVDMTEFGPDITMIEELVKNDGDIVGMWCVPRYSNPTGYTCSSEIVERLAAMPTKCKDFRIFWDDAYAVHFLNDAPDKLLNLLDACKKAGNPDRVFIFSSTSKVSFPGGGVAMLAASEKNCAWLKERLFAQTIGPDKINMLRHVIYFKDLAGILKHMKKQANIIAPKFTAVHDILTGELAGKGIASWTKPAGGYFISLNTLDNCAKRVVALAGELGVKLTPAGATFPYKKDPLDRNIRIAPTFPGLDDLKKATEVLAVCIQYISLG